MQSTENAQWRFDKSKRSNYPKGDSHSIRYHGGRRGCTRYTHWHISGSSFLRLAKVSLGFLSTFWDLGWRRSPWTQLYTLHVWHHINLWWWRKWQQTKHTASQAPVQVPPCIFLSSAPQNSVNHILWWSELSRRGTECIWAKQLASLHTARKWRISGLNQEVWLLILCSKSLLWKEICKMQMSNFHS